MEERKNENVVEPEGTTQYILIDPVAEITDKLQEILQLDRKNTTLRFETVEEIGYTPKIFKNLTMIAVKLTSNKQKGASTAELNTMDEIT